MRTHRHALRVSIKGISFIVDSKPHYRITHLCLDVGGLYLLYFLLNNQKKNKDIINNFAIRLDQVFSVFNSKDTALYENAIENFYELVKEAYETHIHILSYNDGRWETVKELPINNCAVHPRTDGGFDFIIDGHITTYGPNCRFAIG